MSARDWPRRYREFVFGADATRFLKSFALIFYPYCISEIWGTDWTLYATLAPWLYQPIGLPKLIGLPFPDLATVHGIQLAATALALLAMARVSFRTSALGLAALLLLLDAWPNMFGFVNVRIHLVWFAAFLGICNLDRRGDQASAKDEALNSLAFRSMELICVLAYVQAGYAKLAASGLAWAIDGTTLQIGLIRQGTRLGAALAEHPSLMTPLSFASLLLELAFCLYYVWPASRRLLLAASICFHLGTWMTLDIGFSHLWIFSASVLLLPIRRRSPVFSRNAFTLQPGFKLKEVSR